MGFPVHQIDRRKKEQERKNIIYAIAYLVCGFALVTVLVSASCFLARCSYARPDGYNWENADDFGYTEEVPEKPKRARSRGRSLELVCSLDQTI
jgi:hypothetical protein